MKFTHSWLQQHIHTDLTPEQVGEKLTMAGLELDALTDLSHGLEKIQVGVLEAVSPHPDADRLTFCRVGVGEEFLGIVCGARNHKVGDKVAVARIGARLPGGLTIKKSKIRGQTSEGMLCSLKELGLEGESDGILILPEETPDGLTVAEALGRNDWLYELDLTPNRGDCLGVRGIARELGAITGTPLQTQEVAVEEQLTETPEIIIEDGAGCPRYAGRIIRGVTVAPSPAWLRQRLESVGLRSINNIVDITNFILLDRNHPLHAFDLNQLQLPVVVRRGREGETLTTLDEVERQLTPEMTLITDQKRVLALGGIMGGQESGVVEGTTDIFLEAAYFDPITTARTGRRLAIHSDSRHRFERGVDPKGIRQAMERATALILELAGGEAGPIQLVDAGTWEPAAPILFRWERVNRLGGIDLSLEEMERMLTRLGCRKVGLETAAFQPPSHRHDLRREEDLVEEIVRLHGYDRVPATLPRIPVDVAERDVAADLLAMVRRLLTGMGYLETINYAFVGVEEQQRYDPGVEATPLVNPLSEDQAVLRTSLCAGLLACAQRNLSRGNSRLRLFECGRIFPPDGSGGLWERERLAGLLTGSLVERSWHGSERSVDFFDLKGDLELLLGTLGLDDHRFETGGPDFLHPGRKALLFAGNERVASGWMGQLHPHLQEKLDPPQPLFLFELDLQALERPVEKTAAAVFSRFPAVQRDFAFVVDAALPARSLLDEIGKVDETLIRQVILFDVYTGEHVAAGKKSLALGVVLQAPDRTLTDEEIQPLADRITARIAERFEGVLRG